MIRPTQHIAPLRQLQLRLELAARRTTQALNHRRRPLKAADNAPESPAPEVTPVMTPTDLPIADAEAPRDYRAALLSAFSDYYTFEARFDELVQTLCLAAHEGATPARETRYQNQRVWFLTEYAVVQEDLAEYLTPVADTAPTPLGAQSCDAFESLFFPVSLEAMLENDNGAMIDRLQRAQNALIAWSDDLNRARRDLGY